MLILYYQVFLEIQKFSYDTTTPIKPCVLQSFEIF